ncbi:hypothetical protein Q1695_007081 [Nippostrongylus brasiliensis]|nr:hypothetical protein Q1695_007081 [Nippostrongylus brasiliensis]
MLLWTAAVLALCMVLVKAGPPTQIKLSRLAAERRTTIEEEEWKEKAISKLWEERKSMGHTPLVKFEPPGFPNVDIFFKNETASKTRTLKHRFVWALIMWAIVDGKVNSKSTVYDSTSGNTGSSEAYMCTLVGLPYVAVISKDLEVEKIHQITSNGGKTLKTESSLRNAVAKEEAEKNNGYFINQFGNAKNAEEFHESGGYPYESTNVFHEILEQLEENSNQTKKIPDYFIQDAGTGGTITSVGRYVNRYNLPTKIVLSDSEYSLFYDYVINNRFTNESGTQYWKNPGVAGIGYGYNTKPVIYGETTSLNPGVIDEAMKMPDIASAAAAHVLRERGIGGGTTTGLNFLVALYKAFIHKDDDNIKGRLTIATLINDPGELYESTYFNSTWVESAFADKGGMDGLNCWKDVINDSIDNGSNFLKEGLTKCSNETETRVKRWLDPTAHLLSSYDELH